MRAVICLGTFCISLCLLVPYYPGFSPLAQIKRLCLTAGISTQVHMMISSTTVKSCSHTYIIICKHMYSNLLLTRNKFGECRSCREESGRLQCMNKKIALKEESELQSQVKNMSMPLLKDMGPQNIIAGGLGV
jgi:hypothetical protein